MEGRSEKAFEALNKIKDDIKVKVIRQGNVCLIPQQELVVGDIVQFEMGDRTPVAERRNMIYCGCFITGGSGTIIVTEVGDNTEFGNIAKELSGTEKGSTPLQEKLDRLGKIITILGASMAAIVFVIQLIIFTVNGIFSFDTVSEAFITSIVLIVAAVPEGLPTIVAVSLAINIIKMAKQNALVRKLIACETIGCINVICSDKTGTLTENCMTVTDIYSKGSPEKILSQCSKIVINGEIYTLTSERISDVEKKIMSFQKDACRVLAFAHKEFSDKLDYENSRNIIESEMVYDGFVAITDPLREDVFEAVEHCKNAGIDLKIPTGDGINDAPAIKNADVGIAMGITGTEVSKEASVIYSICNISFIQCF